MRKNTTLILVALIIAGGIAALVYYKKSHYPKYNWWPDYKRGNEQPYGLKLFYSVIRGQKSETRLILNHSYNQLDTNLTNSNFIYVGSEFWVDSAETAHILKYVEKGNRVFIASNFCPLEIVRQFVPVGDSIHGYRVQADSIIHVSFTENTIPFPNKKRFHHQFLKDTTGYNWTIYRKRYFYDTLTQYGLVPFSFINDSNVNAFYIPHGHGKLILHANPLLFTNFYLTQQNGFEHANNFLSQLHQGPTYWDDPGAPQNTSGNYSNHNNPLKLLFSHRALQWAWYLLLATIGLYLIFRSKREQRIIPLMPVNTNASIEYTKAIGTLYFQSKGHHHIANEMYIVFLSEVRSRYNLTTDIVENELIDQLAVRSGIHKNVLYNLFKKFKEVRNDPNAKADDLIGLYNSIESYHKKRK